MSIPLLVMCHGRFRAGSKISQMVAKIDVAPTVLELAGIEPPDHLDGKSFLPLLEGEQVSWRDELLYEYYWERNYPQTPTTQAILAGRYKFIRYHGIWDLDELYGMHVIQGLPLQLSHPNRLLAVAGRSEVVICRRLLAEE